MVPEGLPSERSLIHASYAVTSVNRSLLAVAKRARALTTGIILDQCASLHTWSTYWLASSRLSKGLKNNGLEDMHAVIVKIGPKQRKMVPSTSILT
jgi:hypothetical protein